MAAVPVQDPDPVLPVAKHHEIFAQDSHRQGNVVELRGERHRLPIAAKQLAARSPGADVSQLFVHGWNVRQGVSLVGARIPAGWNVHGCVRP